MIGKPEYRLRDKCILSGFSLCNLSSTEQMAWS
jgi:hypothetical protein